MSKCNTLWDVFSHCLVGDDCWEWQRYCGAGKYGQIRIDNRKNWAHRVAYCAYYNYTLSHLDASKLHILHTCDNPKCINPLHLWAGSAADNQHDKARKGRSARGIDNGSAKLTEEQVYKIRNDGRAQQVIALDYMVSQPLIGYIKRRCIWKHLPERPLGMASSRLLEQLE